MSDVLDRFLRYVAFDTQSDEKSKTCPSTVKQLDLLRLLVDELREIGVADASTDDHGYVMATIPATTRKTDVPTVGLTVLHFHCFSLPLRRLPCDAAGRSRYNILRPLRNSLGP